MGIVGKHAAMMALTALVGPQLIAAELQVRNVALVRSGHVHIIVGTLYNVSDHPVEHAIVGVDVMDQGQMIAHELLQVPKLDAGQAWRLAQPIRIPNPPATAQVKHIDAEGLRITIDVTRLPKALVKQ